MPEIVHSEPPLIDEIDRVFHTRGKPVLYSWGYKIYAANGMQMTPALAAHEAVHCERQLANYADPSEWWAKYILDRGFRLREEIPAHQAEYRWHAARPDADKPMCGWRSRKHYHLHFIAMRLSSKLYGSLCSLAAAKQHIEGGASVV